MVALRSQTTAEELDLTAKELNKASLGVGLEPQRLNAVLFPRNFRIASFVIEDAGLQPSVNNLTIAQELSISLRSVFSMFVFCSNIRVLRFGTMFVKSGDG